MVISELKERLVGMDGKIDRVLTVVENVSQRTDRLEQSIDNTRGHLEAARDAHRLEMRQVETEFRNEIEKLGDKHKKDMFVVDTQLRAINWRIALGVGGLSVLITLANLFLKSAHLGVAG